MGNKAKISAAVLAALAVLAFVIARTGKKTAVVAGSQPLDLSLAVAGAKTPSVEMEAVRRLLGADPRKEKDGLFSGPGADELFKTDATGGKPAVAASTSATKLDYAASLLAYAEQGNIPAQNLLAEAYLTGHGAKQDYAEAFKWFKKSADQGNGAAQFKLGGLYYSGSGVKRDLAASLAWLRRSAEAGYAPAQAALGAKHIAGEDVQKDAALGLDWVKKAAEAGHEPSQFQLGSMFYYGRNAAVDKAEAVKWFRLSAASGNPQAQFNAGLMLAKGDGVPQDYEEAFKWLVLASGSSSPALSADASRAMAAVQGALSPDAAARARAEAEKLRAKISSAARSPSYGPVKK